MKFKKHLQKLLGFLLFSVFSLTLFTGCAREDLELAADVVTAVLETQSAISEEGTYTSKEEVAPGMSISGDYFGNYEGLLPEADDRDYYECDIDFDGTYRNGKRIVFSNDGLIYYTEDHYESFELLYGEE